jgi:hypothetical protein
VLIYAADGACITPEGETWDLPPGLGQFIAIDNAYFEKERMDHEARYNSDWTNPKDWAPNVVQQTSSDSPPPLMGEEEGNTLPPSYDDVIPPSDVTMNDAFMSGDVAPIPPSSQLAAPQSFGHSKTNSFDDHEDWNDLEQQTRLYHDQANERAKALTPQPSGSHTFDNKEGDLSDAT